jgi:hypothetical protein
LGFIAQLNADLHYIWLHGYFRYMSTSRHDNPACSTLAFGAKCSALFEFLSVKSRHVIAGVSAVDVCALKFEFIKKKMQVKVQVFVLSDVQ